MKPHAIDPVPAPNRYAAPSASPSGAPLAGSRVAPGAKTALILGVLSLLCFGILFGPLAIRQALRTKEAIAHDPSLTGSGMTTAGMVLGIVALVSNMVFIVYRLAMAM